MHVKKIMVWACMVSAAIGAAVLPASAEDAAAADALNDESQALRVEHESLNPSWKDMIDQIDRWQTAGDVAMRHNQPVVAYPFYYRIARLVPDTAYAETAANRGHSAYRKLRKPGAYPPKESFWGELYDTLTW